MSSSSNKLHPIYVALDNHQYSRAIKLCLAHPESNYLSQALLAHAYAKSGQKYKALLTIQKILPTKDSTFFAEFHSEITHLHVVEGSLDSTAGIITPTLVSSKKTAPKKGKKKVSGNLPQQSSLQTPPSLTQAAPLVPTGWDLVDQLDNPPELSTDWERLPPVEEKNRGAEDALAEPTLLSTLSMTMINQLKLPLTAYQLYCWAASSTHNTSEDQELFLRKAFTNGLVVLLSPQYQSITSTILANMQIVALQLSRLHSHGMTTPVNLWASQTALWQIHYASTSSDSDEKLKLRLAMLPRLAESLAGKSLENLNNASLVNFRHDVDKTLVATESFLVYIRSLDVQGDSKYQEKLEAIDAQLNKHHNMSNSKQQLMMYPPRQALLQMKVDVLQRQGQFESSMRVLEDLIHLYPDDWVYWKSHLECSIARWDGDFSAGCNETISLACTVIESRKSKTIDKYPLRGPQWIQLEASSIPLRYNTTDSLTVIKLIDCVKNYCKEFATTATSTFSDICPFLDLILAKGSTEHALEILGWSKSIRMEPISHHVKTRRSELRLFILSIQINFKVLSIFHDLRTVHLPTWEEIVHVWRKFKLFEISNDSDQAQKESRPADELILLAVQRLLLNKHDKTSKLISAFLLETAIRYSPYNSYLKISLIHIYSQLDATARCWELYSDLYIKHIQHESCTYLILPVLLSGGFYREVLKVCQDILGLQRHSTREAGDFAGRAMENGSICKADEFISFHRKRMFKSLTTLEAKGLVLDCAPMYVQDGYQDSVGTVHGIVGGESDLVRVKQMIAEAYNPSGAFSLLRLKGSVQENINVFSDNRDFGIMMFEVLCKTEFDSREQILSASIRRGCHHNLLIRSALCVDATKGPKKGKVTKTTIEAEKRGKSLLDVVRKCDNCLKDASQPPGYASILEAMRSMCRAMVTVSTGMDVTADILLDTIEVRENAGVHHFEVATKHLINARKELDLTNDISVARSSRFLPDCIVPVFALFQMNAKVADIYGWGKRKRKTKRIAAAIADLSCNLVALLDDILNSTSNLPYEDLLTFKYASLPDFVDPTEFKEICANVMNAQLVTKTRIETIVLNIKKYLLPFNEDD